MIRILLVIEHSARYVVGVVERCACTLCFAERHGSDLGGKQKTYRPSPTSDGFI
jgi:hypothetical protein